MEQQTEEQTAVEWLMNELANTGLLVTKDIDNLVAYRKAKQMEKEQMKDVYMEYVLRPFVFNFEEYYSKKYGK